MSLSYVQAAYSTSTAGEKWVFKRWGGGEDRRKEGRKVETSAGYCNIIMTKGTGEREREGVARPTRCLAGTTAGSDIAHNSTVVGGGGGDTVCIHNYFPVGQKTVFLCFVLFCFVLFF